MFYVAGCFLLPVFGVATVFSVAGNTGFSVARVFSVAANAGVLRCWQGVLRCRAGVYCCWNGVFRSRSGVSCRSSAGGHTRERRDRRLAFSVAA